MSPERQKIVIFSGNCHLSDWSAAGSGGCLREVDMMRDNVSLIESRRYYPDMIVLEKNARKMLTDSGGVQKEAHILKVPCITLRDNTEWVETVEDGWNVLVGADKGRILGAVEGFRVPRSAESSVWGG